MLVVYKDPWWGQYKNTFLIDGGPQYIFCGVLFFCKYKPIMCAINIDFLINMPFLLRLYFTSKSLISHNCGWKRLLMKTEQFNVTLDFFFTSTSWIWLHNRVMMIAKFSTWIQMTKQANACSRWKNIKNLLKKKRFKFHLSRYINLHTFY